MPRGIYIQGSLSERFYGKANLNGPIIRNGLTCCWEWRGGRNKKGYGTFGVRMGLSIGAHRFAWTLVAGPIPKGMEVGHVCDHRCCIRNDEIGIYTVNGVEYERRGHLFLAPHAVNMADAAQKGHMHGGGRGESIHASKLTGVQIIEIRQRYSAGGTSHQRLATEFGITKGSIGDIIRRDTWAHIP